MKTLDNLDIGEYAYIRKLNLDDKAKARMLDLGFIENNIIKCIYKSPANDPRAYLIMGSIIAIRQSDAKNIIVEGDQFGTN